MALVKPGCGACWNHAMNSFRAMLYTRFVIGEETLSSTRAFNISYWAIFSIATKSFMFSLFMGIIDAVPRSGLLRVAPTISAA